MIELGKKQILRIAKKVEFGAYLTDGEEEILLPLKEVPKNTRVGDPLEVFIYRDSSDRLIATVTEPYIKIGEVRTLKVKDVGSIGAFLDWGLPKDLLLPFKEQKGRPAPGDEVEVRIYVDKSNRLCASMWVSDEEKRSSSYESNAVLLKDILLSKKGYLPLTDASSPEEIRSMTGMSKKEFKRAVGNLYKNRMIRIEEKGIRYLENKKV